MGSLRHLSITDAMVSETGVEIVFMGICLAPVLDLSADGLHFMAPAPGMQ